ncbi:MAG: HDOD domain-containing protein [Bradymonadia bacterium]
MNSEFSVEEELWFGTAPDAEAEQRAARSMVAILVETSGVLPFPAAAVRLLTITRDPNYSVAEVERLITSDPGLSSKLLRLVNSGAVGLKHPCRSVSDAITLLGTNLVRGLAAGSAVLETFRDIGQMGAKIKQDSVVVGGLARYIAGRRRDLDAADVYTCALLHDIGKLMMLQVDKTHYPDLLRQSKKEWNTTYVLERKANGFDHGVLAGHLLRSWNIPEPVPTVVAWHHQAGRAFSEGGAVANLVALIRVADRVRWLLEANPTGEGVDFKTLAQDEGAAYLNLTAEYFEKEWLDLGRIRMESMEI